MERLRAAFNKFSNLNDLEWEKLYALMRTKYFKKGTYFVTEGQQCKYVAFVKKGIFSYYYLVDGHQHTRQFFFENNFMANYQSYITGTSSKANIQALQDSEVILINRDDLFNCYEHSSNFQLLGRKVAEYLFLTVSSKYESFLLEKPEERYLHLVKTRPKVIQGIPQYMIASYLGITPEALSRIRKRLYR